MKTYQLLKCLHNESPQLVLESVSLQAVIDLKQKLEDGSECKKCKHAHFSYDSFKTSFEIKKEKQLPACFKPDISWCKMPVIPYPDPFINESIIKECRDDLAVNLREVTMVHCKNKKTGIYDENCNYKIIVVE